MLLKYPLTDNRLQNDAEIKLICNKVGIEIIDRQLVAGRETWYFKGSCNGTMSLVNLPAVLWAEDPALRLPRLECWIHIRKKPWWLFWFVLDRRFKKALV